MRAYIVSFVALLTVFQVIAEPVKVLLIDFEDATGRGASESRELAVTPQALSSKGVYALAGQLLDIEEVSLIDRRDYVRQIDALELTDQGRATPNRPTFLHAAQSLGADVVLRGSILTLSSGRVNVDQGGYKSSHVKLSMRVAVTALDAVDGAVLALQEGKAERMIRQSSSVQTILGEDEVFGLLDEALSETTPGLMADVMKRVRREADRPKVSIAVKTDADPALVEIDGLLVGTTPIEGLQVYEGDHILTVGKPGYRDVTKKILFEKDMQIEAPMIRVELSAEEWKDVLEKIRLNVISGEPGLIVTPLE